MIISMLMFMLPLERVVFGGQKMRMSLVEAKIPKNLFPIETITDHVPPSEPTSPQPRPAVKRHAMPATSELEPP
jgi:hypothetical protein